MNCEDYYEVFEICHNASPIEIKNAYKRTRLNVLPYKDKSDLAHQAFEKIFKAYMCLNHPKSREEYDIYRNE